ncbi:hypothetical protein KC19_9G158300, partial [Ceratodon purpureus]
MPTPTPTSPSKSTFALMSIACTSTPTHRNTSCLRPASTTTSSVTRCTPPTTFTFSFARSSFTTAFTAGFPFLPSTSTFTFTTPSTFRCTASGASAVTFPPTHTCNALAKSAFTTPSTNTRTAGWHFFRFTSSFKFTSTRLTGAGHLHGVVVASTAAKHTVATTTRPSRNRLVLEAAIVSPTGRAEGKQLELNLPYEVPKDDHAAGVVMAAVADED